MAKVRFSIFNLIIIRMRVHKIIKLFLHYPHFIRGSQNPLVLHSVLMAILPVFNKVTFVVSELAMDVFFSFILYLTFGISPREGLSRVTLVSPFNTYLPFLPLKLKTTYASLIGLPVGNTVYTLANPWTLGASLFSLEGHPQMQGVSKYCQPYPVRQSASHKPLADDWKTVMVYLPQPSSITTW